MLQFDYDAVILADGDFPTAEVPLRMLQEASYIVCCDGAARHIPLLPPQATVVIVGDGDSVPDELRHRLIRIDEQDDNDLTKATRHCMEKGCRRIAYLGATGRREDHTLGNMALMARYRHDFSLDVLMATDHGWLVPAADATTFCAFRGQQVSIFNLSCTALKSEGLKWQAYPYRQLWQGILNEAQADSFSIDGNGEYLVFRTYA